MQTPAEHTIELKPYYIREIHLPIFNYNDVAAMPSEVKEKLQISTTIQINVSEDYTVIFTVIFKYYIKDETTETVLIYSRMDFDFVISEADKIITFNSKGKPIIPIDYIMSLSGVVYSTARGIIFAKTLNTALNQYILPVRTTDELVEPLLAILEEEKK